MNSSEAIKKRLYMREYRKTATNRKYVSQYFKDYYKRDYARKAKNERQRKYREINGYPVQDSFGSFRWYLKATYGLSTVEYFQKLAQQKYRCAICHRHYRCFKKRLAVDHSHSTGMVRGLLCHQCNCVLGNAKDKIDTLRQGIKYLKKFK